MQINLNKLAKVFVPVVLGFALVSQSAFAGKGEYDGERKHKRGGHSEIHFIMKKLDLTEQQKEQIKSIKASNQAQRESLKEDLKTFHQELRNLVISDNYSEEAAYALVAQYQSQLNDKLVLSATMRNQIRAVLTTEQQAKFDKIMAHMKKRKHKKHHAHKKSRDGE
ncbi:Spy/CpxP family protein refolding chaperone [Catenovulum sediminis]|uniref:Spy/CpxP family protein refolding chaperone n=1 Tax=Catenovulum sediminis TaxID=1740262 RepID=A0ABV1RNW0_9ALTE